MQGLSEHHTQNLGKLSCLLIVDDDPFLRASLCQQLNAEGFQNVFDTGTVNGFRKILEDKNPDLILLDLQMPSFNSIELCESLRSDGFVKPIMIMIAENAGSELVKGLEAGADDYITKPIRMSELLARINTQLQKFEVSDDTRFVLAELHFFPTNKMVQKIGCGRTQALTEKETTILKFLYRAFPEPVTKDELLSEVWGLQTGLTTHTLETHIYRLRQKISYLTKTPLVVTVENGYRLKL